MEPEQGTVNSIQSWNHMCFCSNTQIGRTIEFSIGHKHYLFMDQHVFLARIRLCVWYVCISELSGISGNHKIINMYTFISKFFLYTHIWKYINTCIYPCNVAHEQQWKNLGKIPPTHTHTPRQTTIDPGVNLNKRAFWNFEAYSLMQSQPILKNSQTVVLWRRNAFLPTFSGTWSNPKKI